MRKNYLKVICAVFTAGVMASCGNSATERNQILQRRYKYYTKATLDGSGHW